MDTSRYLPNPAVSNPELLQQQQNDRTDWIAIAKELMAKCLFKQQQHRSSWSSRHTSSSLGTLYVGTLGAQVYLKWRMARLLRETDPPTSQHLLQEALETAQEQLHVYEPPVAAGGSLNPLIATSRRVDGRETVATLLEGSYVGCKALVAVLLHEINATDPVAQQHAQTLIESLQKACERRLSADECEVLYGRAGALQAILFLRSGLQSPLLGSTTALAIARAILQQGQRNGASSKEVGLDLLWTWHDSLYLGAAHGVVGILHMLLQLHPTELETLRSEQWLDRIRNTIQQLEQFCFPSGNLDSSIHLHDSRRKDKLVHWCHGAPGYVLLLLQAAVIFEESSFRARAQQVADQVIWPRGLLHKGVGLCHGIAGNAYALAAVGRTDASFQNKARYFAHFALEHLIQLEPVPDHPYSLFEGLSGLCVLAMDLVQPEEARFPLYEF